MGNVPVDGAITFILKHSKELLLKRAPYFFFSDFCRKCHATIHEDNQVDPIGGLNLKV